MRGVGELVIRVWDGEGEDVGGGWKREVKGENGVEEFEEGESGEEKVWLEREGRNVERGMKC